MDDKNLMENLLLVEKSVCDLFLHGAVEASTSQVRGAFDSALEDSLRIQASIYDKMTQKGWYPTEQAEAQQITKVKQKYSAQQQ